MDRSFDSVRGDILGKAFETAGIIAYQDGSIVSREIIKKRTGSVTIFAFDKGQGLSEHTAPFDALVFIVDGEAEVSIGGHPHIVKAHDMIVMPAGVPHSLQARKRFKMALVMIRSEEQG